MSANDNEPLSGNSWNIAGVKIGDTAWSNDQPASPASPGSASGSGVAVDSRKGKDTAEAKDEPTLIVESAANPVVDEKVDVVDTDFGSKGLNSKSSRPSVISEGNLPTDAPQGFANSATEHEATFIFKKGKSRQVPSLIGKEVGPYEITSELGRGGMGVVYKARHKVLRRDVALKMILRSSADSVAISRFRDEARSVATLKHPGIVQIHEYGEHEGTPWFSLEFVDGDTLSQLTSKEPLEPKRAAQIVADIAAAVSYAHDQNVLHRDIKPANILMAEGDVPKLTDFGLAKNVSSEGETSDHKTIDGQIMGTPGYMPPEQARGMTSRIGPHSDQYSLAATLYYLLTGRAPFVGTSIDVVLQVINKDPLTLRQMQPNTPRDLETICLKAMSKDPARRYASCAEFEADLRRFLRNEPILARPISWLERSVRWCRRNPRTSIPIAVAVVSLLTAFSVSLWSAVTLAAKNRDIEKQNQEITQKNVEIGEQKDLAIDRATDAKNSVYEVLKAVRNDIPVTEPKLRPVREKLLRIASDQLDRLPDSASDKRVSTGLEKARLLEERYLTALEIGEPSKALVHLDAAEKILRERNQSQGTDVTRLNLTKLLYHQCRARTDAQRNMQQVLQYGKEALELLDDILAHPNPAEFNTEEGSVPKFNVIERILSHGYQHALNLKNLGRVQEAFAIIERAFERFDEGLDLYRKSLPNQPTGEEWVSIREANRAKLTDQIQLRAVLLGSLGRGDEAITEEQRILENVRQLVASEGTLDNYSKLTLALVFSGVLLKQRGQIDEALAVFEEAANITRAIYKDNPMLDERRNGHHVSLMHLAGLVRLKDLPRARELYAEARQIAQEMVDADNDGIAKQVALALVSPFSGPPGQAVSIAEDLVHRVDPLTSIDAELMVDMARVFAASAEAAGLMVPPDTESAMTWKNRSLALIADAIREGYRDTVYLAGEPDLVSLRALPEFMRLLEQGNGSQSRR